MHLSTGVLIKSLPSNNLIKKDGATIHSANATMGFFGRMLDDRVMSGRRRGGTDWPPTSPDLSPADFWLHGYLKVGFNLSVYSF